MAAASGWAKVMVDAAFTLYTTGEESDLAFEVTVLSV
jgi:hypothetical protein